MAEDFEKIQKAINQHREKLTKGIKVHNFYDKLRSRDVFSFEDYQEIENSKVYVTDVEKAGLLLDTISTKGPNGYKVFMECLDDHYPHLYQEITGIESSPRTHNHNPGSGSYSPIIDFEGVRKLTAQLDEMNRTHAADQLAISELREELFKLRFVNTTCKAKLSKYPRLVEKTKQMDLELRELKEWQLNNIIKINQLEKENTRLKFERKEHKQTIDQLHLKLTDAVDMHQCQKHNWERTNSKNEQLAQDKNNLEKRLEHMQREIETVKRQSSLWSTKGVQISEDNIINDPQALIEIYKTDLAESRKECKDLVDRLYKERNDMECRDMHCEKMSAENEELQHMLGIVQKDLETTNRNYQLTWQELQRMTTERNYAFEQRARAQSEAQEQRKERERLRQTLNEQLKQFKRNLYDVTSSSVSVNGDSKDDDFLSPDLSRHKELRVSGYSDTSGVSSGQASSSADIGPAERKSATLPNRTIPTIQHFEKFDTNPEIVDGGMRPRTTNVLSRPSHSRTRSGQNPFPVSDFPLTLDIEASRKKTNSLQRQNGADKGICETQGCVTPEDVAKGFKDRPAHFADSTRSDLAMRGSNRDKNYHRQVDLWIMKESFKVRPPLNSSFSIDYEDENEDLERIFADDRDMIAGVKSQNKKLKRRSRSLSNLTLSSDDSDDGPTGGHRSRPQASKPKGVIDSRKFLRSYTQQ